MENSQTKEIDLTDLSSFNKSLGSSSSRGIGSIGLRNTKNLFEKTDVIVRTILSEADHSSNHDHNISKEYLRLGKLYGCGYEGIKKVQNHISYKNKSNHELFKYKTLDWDNIRTKLWNSHIFKDGGGIQRLEQYQEQTITLTKLESLMKYIFHIQFTQKEIAALVCELKCTKVVLGETIIQFPLLLTELKLLGNAARSSELTQHLQQSNKDDKEQSILSNYSLAQQLQNLTINCSILYATLKNISSTCILAWKKEKSYFIQLLHEIPTGTLDAESLREFFSYNINAKLTYEEALLIIYYFNGIFHRYANIISLSDLVKDMKLLALQMPSAILAPPSENNIQIPVGVSLSSHNIKDNDWYNYWCQTKVKAIEDYFHLESQRILRSANDHHSATSTTTTSGYESHITRIKKSKNHYLLNHLKINNEEEDDDEDENEEEDEDDNASVSSLGMESVQSNSKKLKKNILKYSFQNNKTKYNLKRQSSTSSSISSKFLSPVKSSNVSEISLNTTTGGISSSSIVDIQGKVQSIHYNRASPHIFSLDALKERNNVVKELDAQQGNHGAHEVMKSEVKDLLLKGKKKDNGLSFALGAAIVMRAHNVKSKIAEENEELLLEEMAMKQHKNHDVSLTTRMGLPTHVGYYEATRGSTILRAKTPMYLIRPVNGSDSVLAMNHNKTSLRGKGDSNTSTSMNSDDYSISTLHSNDSTSISDPSKMIKKKKKQKNYQNDLHIQNTIRSELECGYLDEKGYGLRYDLRYQELGEFIRCVKLNSKHSLDDLILLLWNTAQDRMGKGINPMSESGVVIERLDFVRILHEVFTILTDNHCHALFSSLDPTRRGYIPCHILHSLGSVALLKPGASINIVVMSCLKSVIWEFLNTNRDIREVIKYIISPLSMHNTSYQTRKSQHEEENILKENAAMTHPVGSLAKSSSGGVSSSSGGGGGYKIKNQSTNNILITLEEQQLENEILMRTYLPFHLISTCFRNMCTSYEIEKMLIMKINDLHHQILNKNIRLGSHFHHSNPSTSSSSSSTATSISSVAGPPPSKEDLIHKYELLMRPTAVTDVKIQDLINYLDESNNEITKILLIEQRKLTKKLTKYFYKSNDKEKL